MVITPQTPLVLACATYLCALIMLSALISKKMKGLTDFFLAGKSLPTGLIALAYVASCFGAGSTIGSMNDAFARGVSAVWLIAIPVVISCILVGCFFAKKIRAMNALSLPQAIERCYGPVGSGFLSCVLLMTITTFVASQLFAAGQIMQMTLSFPPLWAIGAVTTVIVIYSIIGGFRAVVMTDLMQFTCYTLAILILLVYTVMAFTTHHLQFSQLQPGYWNWLTNGQSHLAIVFTFVLAWSIAPEMWQRMAASQTPQSAKNAALLAGGILAVLYVLIIVIGILGRALLPPDDPSAAQNVLLTLAFHLPAHALTAIVLIGVLSAITSTADSSLNVGSLTLTRDILLRFVWPSATGNQQVLLSRMAMVVMGLPAAAVALYYHNLIQILWISADVYASTMFVPIMGLFYSPRYAPWAGVFAMSFGSVPVLLNFGHDLHVLSLPLWWPGWPYTTLIGIACSLVGYGVGRFIKGSKPVAVDTASAEAL